MQAFVGVEPTYNRLATVFDADMALQCADRDTIIESLLDLIVDFDLHESVGLRLLHRHNDIGESEVMLEEARVDGQGLALITVACPAATIDSTVAVNSWLLGEDDFVPMEYSRATLLESPEVCPASYPEFFAALAKRLRELKVEKWVGPALIESKSVSEHACGRNVLLEQSAIDDRANVLRYVSSHEVEAISTVETFWVSSIEAATKKTSVSKEPPKTKTTKKVCKRICPLVQNPPVHQGTYIHNSEA